VTLVVIDMQAKLMPHIDGGERLGARVGTLMRAAELLDVPVIVTEQNPRGLGATLPELVSGRLWIAGAEAHVCVLLTALGLLQRGYRVEWVADAVGSRHAEDRAVAAIRAQQDGARLTTVETTLFGWLGDFRHPRFRDVLALIK
jgi:nicotinamidase-related amidase